MKQFFTLFIILIIVFPCTASSESLVIAGTGDSQELLGKLALLYEKKHPENKIIIPDSIGSGGGVKSLIKGSAGLARTARELKPREKNNSLTQIPFALSPVVFAGHPGIAMVKNITLNDIINIYNKTITNWQKLGGEDRKIYPIDREIGDSSRITLEKYFKSINRKFPDNESEIKVYYTTPETVQAIARNKYTIGYMPLSMARAFQLHIFSIDSILPDEINIRNRKYPFTSVFYLIKPAAPTRLAENFIAFIQEQSTQEFMLSSGVIPLPDNQDKGRGKK